MNNFLREKIIIPSWDIIKDDADAKKFYFIPGVLSIIFLTTILVYQTIYTYVVIFWNEDKILKLILDFVSKWIWLKFLITLIIFLILYFIFVPIFDAWLVKYIDRKVKNEKISKSDAFWQWLFKFLQIFEYNNLLSPFKILSIVNGYLFIIRFFEWNHFQIITYSFSIALFFWVLINILFSYSRFFIILENKKVFEAIWESTKLAILNPKNTIKLFFIIFFLNFRIIFNFIIFLIFPILIASAIAYISTKFLLMITITTLTIIFVWLIFFVWYLSAVLEVFNTSIWYFAYKYGKENSEK